jgi:hypothetical protein
MSAAATNTSAAAATTTSAAATDSTRSPSHRDVRGSAKQHFTIFLQNIGSAKVKELCRNQDGLFRSGEELTFDNMDFEKVTYGLFDHFANYLFATATHLPTSNTPQASLSLNSGSTYFSQVKMTMVEGLLSLGKTNFDLSSKEGWSKLRNALQKGFCNEAEAKNKPVMNPRTTPDEDDITCLTVTCITSQDPELAVFFAFVISSIQFFGRGTETARAEFGTLTTESPPEFDNNKEKIAVLALWRRKTQVHQHLSLFGHRTSPLKDWYFALGYMMIMNNDKCPENDAIFPSFHKRAGEDIQREKEKKPTASHVSKHWDRNLKKCLALSTDLAEKVQQIPADSTPTSTTAPEYCGKKLNPKLTSHSTKRYAMELANMSPFIKFTWLCSRTGYKMDNFHTAFEYFSGDNKVNDRQASLGVNEWKTLNADGRIGGGRPPLLESLGTADDAEAKARLLRDDLFCSYERTEGANDIYLQNILLATMLKDLLWLVSLLLGHPLKLFGTKTEDVWAKHMFLQRLAASALIVGIDNPPETLMIWSVTIQEDWVRRNYAYVPLSQLISTLGEDNGALVDPRSLMTVIKNIEILVSDIHNKFNHQTNEITYLKNAVVTLTDAHQKQTRQMLIQSKQITELSQRSEQRSEQILLESQRTNSLLAALLAQSNDGAGARAGGAGLGPADMLVLNPIAPAVSPATITPSRDQERANEGSPAGNAVESLTLRSAVIELPLFAYNPSMKGVSMRDAFTNWFQNQWYLVLHDSRWTSTHNRSILRVCLEYFLLFLDSPVNPMPMPLQPRHPDNRQWREELSRHSQQGLASFQEFWHENIEGLPQQQKQPPDFVSGFKKLMTSTAVTTEMIARLPGHALHTSFHPMNKKKVQTLRCKGDIIKEKTIQAKKEVERQAAAAARGTIN